MTAVFVRFGALPEGGRSSRHSVGGSEAGVSVYAVGGDGRLVVPDGEWAAEDLHARLTGDDEAWLVTGRVVGEGADGEPVLADAEVVGRWDPAEHYDADDLAYWRRVHHGGLFAGGEL